MIVVASAHCADGVKIWNDRYWESEIKTPDSGSERYYDTKDTLSAAVEQYAEVNRNSRPRDSIMLSEKVNIDFIITKIKYMHLGMLKFCRIS